MITYALKSFFCWIFSAVETQKLKKTISLGSLNISLPCFPRELFKGRKWILIKRKEKPESEQFLNVENHIKYSTCWFYREAHVAFLNSGFSFTERLEKNFQFSIKTLKWTGWKLMDGSWKRRKFVCKKH